MLFWGFVEYFVFVCLLRHSNLRLRHSDPKQDISTKCQGRARKSGAPVAETNVEQPSLEV